MSAEQGLHLGWIDVLSARDDHVALAVNQINVALLIAAREFAYRAVVAAECFARFLRQLPIAIERVRIARIELPRLAVLDVIAIRVEQQDRTRTDALPPNGAELGELLVWMQHCDPARFGRTVELKQTGILEIVHDGQLGVAAGRR